MTLRGATGRGGGGSGGGGGGGGGGGEEKSEEEEEKVRWNHGAQWCGVQVVLHQVSISPSAIAPLLRHFTPLK